MTDFALGANGGFLGASGFTTLNAGAEAAKPLGDSRPPSAITPRLRPDLQKNSRRVTARVFRSLNRRLIELALAADSVGAIAFYHKSIYSRNKRPQQWRNRVLPATIL